MRRLLVILPVLLAGCGRSPVAPPADGPPPAFLAPVPAPVPVATPGHPAVMAHPAIDSVPAADRKRILFLTDNGEHGWMQHENTAGAMLIGKRLAAALPGCEVMVLRDDFPDEATLAAAASVVLFASGQERNLLDNPVRRDALASAMRGGCGLAVLHWCLEAGTPEGAGFLRDYLGGWFEVDYSVNPMWLAKFDPIVPHETTRGVRPYTIYDEFYFNLRLPEVPGRRTAVLEAVPPKRVVVMPDDGPRSNNPTVRASLGKPHVLAWTYERPGGGRSLGFTGGHFHWDWKHDDQRRFVLNGIAWTAGFAIPEGGVSDQRPEDQELLEHQDSPPEPAWKPMPGQPGRDPVAMAPQPKAGTATPP